jgi:hypothetical protein
MALIANTGGVYRPGAVAPLQLAEGARASLRAVRFSGFGDSHLWYTDTSG